MGRRHLASASLAALLCIGLAGCGEDSPKPGPVTESTATTSPDEAATEAAATWIDALNSSARSLDASQLGDLSAPQCEACSIIVKYIDGIGASGGVIKGGQWSNAQLSVRSRTENKVVIDARVAVSPQRVRESSTAKVKRFPGGTSVPKRLTLEKEASKWLVVDLAQEDTL